MPDLPVESPPSPIPAPAHPVDPRILGKVLEESNSTLAPDLKRVDFKQTWDDDCEQVVILHPSPPGTEPHIHHAREVTVKKEAKSITLEPMMYPGAGSRQFNEKMTFVRTTETDTHGRAIFRQGVATS